MCTGTLSNFSLLQNSNTIYVLLKVEKLSIINKEGPWNKKIKAHFSCDSELQ